MDWWVDVFVIVTFIINIVFVILTIHNTVDIFYMSSKRV